AIVIREDGMVAATSTLKDRQEWAQPALIVGSAAFAYVVPFEGLLYAYAILGPAHYLTELNWLHDRGYFIADRAARWLFLALGLVGLALILFVPRLFGSYGQSYMVVMVAMSTLLLTRLPVWAVAAGSAAVGRAAWRGGAGAPPLRLF